MKAPLSRRKFIGAATFEALTARPVSQSVFGDSRHPLGAHIELAERAQLLCIAPATADFMARVAHGHADDLLTACLLANSSPVLLVPAMNDRMWANAQTVRNAIHLR